MSTALTLFRQLCDVATALDCLREAHDPATETWLALTCIAQAVDKTIDDLVRSQGIGGKTMPRDVVWHGAYADGWQDLIVPDAFSHPAKVARGLAHRIYRHLIDNGYVHEGDTILDPFAGIGGFCLDAMTYGLRYVGIELEPRFVTLAQQNLDLWRQRYGFTGGTVVQGDSRRLREVLAGAQVGCVVGSPPYAEGWHRADSTAITEARMRKAGYSDEYIARKFRASNASGGNLNAQDYGHTPGQLGAMPPGTIGAVVGSPPWHNSQEGASVAGPSSGMWQGYEKGFRRTETGPIYASSQEHYGHTPGQLGAMPPGTIQAVVGSPPYAESLQGTETTIDVARIQRLEAAGYRNRRDHGFLRTQHSRTQSGDYGTTPGQLGNTAPGESSTFWSASAQIMAELAALLPPGAVCAWVLKAYVKDKQVVPFPDQWRQLCEAHGFETREIIHASLVEYHGTQEGLFGEAEIVQTARKSFFRRLAERKGSPRIDHETVLILTRDGQSRGTDDDAP